MSVSLHLPISHITRPAYLVCSITHGEDAVKVPLSEDVFLQRNQDRRDSLVQDFLELESWGDVVVFPLSQDPPLVFLGVGWDIVAVSSLRQLEEVEPVNATSGASIENVRLVLPENRV